MIDTPLPFGRLQQVDDFRDEENIPTMANAMATTGYQAAESHRQHREEKRRELAVNRRRVSPAVGYIPAKSKPVGGALYDASVGPTRLEIGGGHGISGAGASDTELDYGREATASAQSGSGECIFSRSARPGPALISGRQVIRGGSVMEVLRFAASREGSSERSEIDESALFASADPGPPLMNRL